METTDEGGRMADQKLQGKKIAFIATDMVEEVELTKPWEAVKEAGGEPELISMETGEIQAFNHYDKSNTYKVDRDFSSARVDDYDGLVIPGGVGNPDRMRMDENAVSFGHAALRQRGAYGINAAVEFRPGPGLLAPNETDLARIPPG